MKMKSIFKTWLLAALLLLDSGSAWGQIISQYIETNSGTVPKGIEVWNNTDATLDFSANDLIIQQGTNGAALTNLKTVSTGTLAPNAVIVIGTSDIGTYLIGQGLSVTFVEYAFTFNGDDALVVKYGGSITDIFGKPGNDPGSAWSGNGVSTANQNIALKSGVTNGSADAWTDPSQRYETISTTPSTLPAGLSGFGIAPTPATSPTLLVSTASLSGFGYVEGGGPSSEQTFMLSGANLTTDITVAAPTNYEISKTSGSGFTSSLTYVPVSGTVDETSVYVRLKSGLALGNYNNETITASSTGVSDATVTVSGTVFKPEPTNHVTGFTATTNSYSSITVTWTDATGAQLPDGYLVKAAVDPVTPTAPVDNTSESDATLIKNIDQGVQTVEFTGLNPSTTYNFSIWPYTNSGANINYKTEGSVPNASATTLIVNIPKIFISEYIEGSSNNKAIEIYNGESTEIDLSKLTVELYSNGSSTVPSTYSGTGTLSPGGVIIIYNSSANAAIQSLGTTSSSVANFNGDDALKVLYDGIVTDVFGEIGNDPGAGWSVAGVSTATVDKTLLRKLSITTGNTTNLGSFGTDSEDSEWVVNAIDYIGNLGSFGTAFTGASDSSWETSSNWDIAVPATSQKVIIPSVTNSPIIDSNVEVSELLLRQGASLTINSTKSLTVSGNLTLKSDATNGTATLIDNGTLTVNGTSTVQQHLTGATGSGRNWWYIGTPVTGAKTDIFGLQETGGTNKMGYYQENKVGGPAYVQITNTTTDLVPGMGYALNTGGSDAVYNFTGTLKSGNVSMTLTRTGTTNAKRGFNLIANPYPSYLDWDLAHDGATNVRPTIWYRTYANSAMSFHTYNDGVAVPGGSVSGKIPPMQAFWVRVDADGSDGSLVFTNAMREHAGGTSNLLKAPAATAKQIVRIAVSNGVNSDETVLVTNEKAADNYDYYDSEKMSNDNVNVPEIFTLAGNQELVINTLHSIEHGKELILGFRPGKSGEFSIALTEFANLDMEVVLKDKVAAWEQELKLGESYNFTSDANATNDRFTVLFRTPGSITGVETAMNSLNVFANSDNRITVQLSSVNAQSVANVYNMAGQLIASQALKGVETVINIQLNAGVYLVKVSNGVTNNTQRVIIK